MCGIAGIVCSPGSNVPHDWPARPLRTLSHRGPDDLGWLDYSPEKTRVGRGDVTLTDATRAVLLHRRLSILDQSSAGWQPMATADGNAHIVFNGEIYNYLELRQELIREGCSFRSQSDTEVLLHALTRWGPSALRRLVGMFALVILDARKRTLFLARDFFGIKPLYYVQTGQTFAFASEIKALLELPHVRRTVDPQRLYEYLHFARTDHGDATLLTDVRQLPAGCFMEVPLDRPGTGEPVRYWDLDLSDRLDLSFDEAARHVRELFLESVRLHLRSDVPVGAALSGGIDSSAIVAAMRALAPRADLHVFSYVADDAGLSEERWVDLAAGSAGANPHKIHASPDEMIDDLDQLIYAQDEPFGSTSIYAQYRVFRQAQRAGVKVMLDGQGADEMLAGYTPYRAARLASLVRQRRWLAAARFARRACRLPGTGGARRLMLQVGGLLCSADCKALARRLLGDRIMPSWLNEAWFRARGVPGPSIRRQTDRDVLREQLRQALESTSLPMLLRYEDRNSMASSIESRVPFLTPALVNFVMRLPEEYLIGRRGTSKNVFRRAMRGLVPDPILDRRDKIGFATPEQSWLTTLRPWVEATLNSPRARAIPALSVPGLHAEWQAVLASKKPFDFRVWRWLNLIRWADRFDIQFEA